MRASWPSLISSRPVMRRPSGFEPDKAGGQRSEELQKLVAPHRLGDHNAAPKHQRREPERRAWPDRGQRS
jgi:hypothetical protein